MTNEVEIIVERKQLGPYFIDTRPVVTAASVGSFTVQLNIPFVNYNSWQIGNYIEFTSSGQTTYIRDITYMTGTTVEITLQDSLSSNANVNDTVRVKPFVYVGERLDIYENESIAQNWNFTDVGEFKTVGSYSREFRIPLTNRNENVFGSIGNVNFSSQQGSDNFYFTRLPAEIRVNTLPIATGHLRVMRTYKQLDKITDIEVSFYSESSDLLRAIGDKKLADLTNLSALNHQLDKTVALQSPFLNDFIYFLADRGQKWDETGAVGTRYITATGNPVQVGDLTPAVKWSWLFNEILSDAGYTYDATTLQSILENYWMPWINKQTFVNPDQFVFLAQLTANTTFTSGNFLSGTTAFVNNDGVYASDTFTCPFQGTYYFQIWTSMYLTQIAPFFNARIVEVYLNDDFQNIDILVGTFTNNGGANEYFGGSLYASQFFAVGTNVRVKYRIYNGAMVELTGIPHTFLFNSVQGQGTGWKLMAADFSAPFIFMNTLAPDVKQIDFIRDVIKMHNLAVISDRLVPNKIAFEPMNDYLQSGVTKDWTNKLDISKDIVVESTTDLQKNKLSFTYTAGTDAASKAYVDGAGRVYGEYKIEGYLTNQQLVPNAFATDSVEVKLTCESSPAQNIQGTSFPIQKFIDKDLNFVVPKMRCLYYAGLVYGVALEDGGGVSFENVNTLNHYSNVAPNIIDYDLNWAPEVPLHYIIANPYNNLFNLYWREYLDGLYSPEARLMTAQFALNLTDVLTFQFNDKIWIKDSYWRILEINDYKVGRTELTQVKLLKITNSTVDCDVVPVGSEPNGEVIWEDGAGNTQNGTRVCCQKYGWFWSTQKGKCYSNVSTDPSGGGTDAIVKTTPTNINSKNIPLNSLSSVIASTVDTSSGFSVFAGNKIEVGANNLGTLAVGRSLKLDAEKNGAVLLGKNVLAKTSGLHLGGGWIANNSINADGGQQFGVVMFSLKDNIAASMDTLPLFIEGITDNHIELENETSQVCCLTLNIQYDGFYGYAVIWFRIAKDSAGVCTASSPVLYYQESDGTASASLVIDTTTNPSQHRLLFQAYGTGFPYGYIVTASLQYTQQR